MGKRAGIGLFAVAILIALMLLLPALGLAFLAGGGGSDKDSQATDSDLPPTCDKLSGTPREIINQTVLPIAHQIAFKDITPETVDAANAAHGPTTDGGRSDHQGPPDVAWAADISNGGSPTPEMDRLAKELAKCFGLKWSGSGAVTGNKDGYRAQMIYRSNVGGNHYNHVHIGIRKE